MDKKELRKQIRRIVSSMDAQDKDYLSFKASDSVGKLPEWKTARNVLLFSSLEDEIDTGFLIERTFLEKKNIILPVVEGDNLRLLLNDPSKKMKKGAFGIDEPSNDSEEINPEDIDIAFIPGRAFTLDGKRLGRGKGYYDRLLPGLGGAAYGLCFPQQIVDDIPTDEWDIPVKPYIYWE